MQVQQQQERIFERDAQLQRLQADVSELQLEQHAHQQSASKIAALQKQVDIHLESTAKYSSLVASAKLANEASAASILSLQSSHTQTKNELSEVREQLVTVQELHAPCDRLISKLEAELKIAAHQRERDRATPRGQVGDRDVLEGAKSEEAADPQVPHLGGDGKTVSRALELVELLALAIKAEVLATHEAIVAGSELMSIASTNSTIGLAFDSASLIVTRVLIGGPAFETQQIFEGDTLVSIDGVSLQGSPEKTSALIKGTDVPGSECRVQVRKKDSTQTQTVVLFRQADTLLGHKRQMWDILSKANAAFEKLGEHEKAKLIAAAKDLWSKTLLEQHRHGVKCNENVASMRNNCSKLLDELRSLLTTHRSLPDTSFTGVSDQNGGVNVCVNVL